MSVITKPDDVAVADTHEGNQSLLKRLANTQSFWILGVLLVIVAFFSIAAGGKFLSTSNFSLISQNVAVWAVLGIGMTFVIITSGIDLSIGSVLVFSSVVAAKVMESVGGQGWGTAFIGIIAALISGVSWGLLNGVLVAKAKIPALIVTLGTLSVALGLAQVITDGIDVRAVPTAMTDFNTYIKIAGIPSLPFIALILLIIGGIVLHRTKFGRYTYAVGSNEEATRRVGVKVDRHLIRIYGLSGLARRVRGDDVAGAVRDHDDRRPVPYQPQRDRCSGHRRHVHLRWRRLDLRNGRRPLHSRRPSGRFRDHRRPALLAGRSRRHRPGGCRLRRPVQARRGSARRQLNQPPQRTPAPEQVKGTCP